MRRTSLRRAPPLKLRYQARQRPHGRPAPGRRLDAQALAGFATPGATTPAGEPLARRVQDLGSTSGGSRTMRSTKADLGA